MLQMTIVQRGWGGGPKRTQGARRGGWDAVVSKAAEKAGNEEAVVVKLEADKMAVDLPKVVWVGSDIEGSSQSRLENGVGEERGRRGGEVGRGNQTSGLAHTCNLSYVWLHLQDFKKPHKELMVLIKVDSWPVPNKDNNNENFENGKLNKCKFITNRKTNQMATWKHIQPLLICQDSM
ncbi:hypothetical protein COCNU_scaffold007880G000060 [Cocos nucifera]|nr:hypothetical protein [Cocos nucifera]